MAWIEQQAALRESPEDDVVHSIFFALRPDAPAAARALDLATRARRRFMLTGAPVAVGLLHVSINPVGRTRQPAPHLIARVVAAAMSVRMGPFRLAFNRMATWGRGSGKRPLVLFGDDGVEGVNILHGRIHDAFARAGLAPWAQPRITPHMTLLWDARVVPEEGVAPVVWTVDEVLLLDSRRGEGRHEVLGRFPLR